MKEHNKHTSYIKSNTSKILYVSKLYDKAGKSLAFSQGFKGAKQYLVQIYTLPTICTIRFWQDAYDKKVDNIRTYVRIVFQLDRVACPRFRNTDTPSQATTADFGDNIKRNVIR